MCRTKTGRCTCIRCWNKEASSRRGRGDCFSSWSHGARSWWVEGGERKESWKAHTVIKMDALLTVSEQQLLNLGGTWKSLSILLGMEVNRLFGLRTAYYSNSADPESFAISLWRFGGLCPGGFSTSLVLWSPVWYMDILISSSFSWNSLD